MGKYFLFIFGLAIIMVCILFKYYTKITWYVYEKNAYSHSVFEEIKEICEEISTNDMIRCEETGRLIFSFPVNHPIYSLVYDSDFVKKMKHLTGVKNLVPCLEVPVEYRKYFPGSEMKWHRDTSIVENGCQYEGVITLSNTSDSSTEIDKIFYIEKIYSEENTLVCVRGEEVMHRVTKSTEGERSIVKIIFTCE